MKKPLTHLLVGVGNLWHCLKPAWWTISLKQAHFHVSAKCAHVKNHSHVFSSLTETVINSRINVDILREQFTTTTFIFALACNSMHPTELFFKANKKYMWTKLPRKLKNKHCCKHVEIIFSVKRSASVCAKRLMLMTAWQELNINSVPFGWAAILGSSKHFSWRM